MKKLIALVLCLLTVLSLFACAAETPSGTTEPTQTETVPEETELGPEVVEKKDFSKFAGIVEDPTTWYEEFMALPIANANMTEEELRQLCVDAFKANLTFQWTPCADITYTYELLDKYSDVHLPIGYAYSGLCYATGIANATCGTIWKILPYYDKETGVLDVEAMGGLLLNNISSACAYGAAQGWNRVSDNHGVGAMSAFNMYDANIVPVGPYTYEPSIYNDNFGSRTASNAIIAHNGEEVMYESYALMKMADGVYSSSSWHVMMIAATPVVVRDANGKIDPEKSHVLIHEQGATGTKSDKNNIEQENGFQMRPLGTINREFTFKKLLEKGYIPFTLKEFTGEEPVEPGQAWIGMADAPYEKRFENGKVISVAALSTKTLFTNYALCNIEIQVKNPDGQVLVSYYPNIPTSPLDHSVMLTDPNLASRVKPYANGKNTIHIYAQLANGERIEAFNTTLKA